MQAARSSLRLSSFEGTGRPELKMKTMLPLLEQADASTIQAFPFLQRSSIEEIICCLNSTLDRAQKSTAGELEPSARISQRNMYKIDFSLGYTSRGSTRAYGISISIFRARAFEWSWFRLCWDSLRGDRARIWGRKKTWGRKVK